jgi:hypothetical protein
LRVWGCAKSPAETPAELLLRRQRCCIDTDSSGAFSVDGVVYTVGRSVSAKLFDELKVKQWTADELQQRLGAPSYHWHVHGIGYFGLTYVPEGIHRRTGDPETW